MPKPITNKDINYFIQSGGAQKYLERIINKSDPYGTLFCDRNPKYSTFMCRGVLERIKNGAEAGDLGKNEFNLLAILLGHQILERMI